MSGRKLLLDEPNDFSGEAIELLYDGGGPIALRELAQSFTAVDVIYNGMSASGERLAVTELRTGSVIATIAPFVPILSQPLEAMNAANTVGDFVKRLTRAVRAFADLDVTPQVATEAESLAAEIVEVLKPLQGRPGAKLKAAHIKFRGKTKNRAVEFEAVFDAGEIDRAAINATRVANGELRLVADAPALPQPRQQLHRKVRLSFHQANKGPAKAKGHTGDKATVGTIWNKPLPVYFAETMEDLKAKLVGAAKNPLKTDYIVDLLADMSGDEPISYTVIEVHGAARGRRKQPDDLLKGVPKRRKSR